MCIRDSYTAPRQMGFIAASAILIGGASVSRAKISHVIIGADVYKRQRLEREPGEFILFQQTGDILGEA